MEGGRVAGPDANPILLDTTNAVRVSKEVPDTGFNASKGKLQHLFRETFDGEDALSTKRRPKLTSGIDALQQVMQSHGVGPVEAFRLLKEGVTSGRLGVKWKDPERQRQAEAATDRILPYLKIVATRDVLCHSLGTEEIPYNIAIELLGDGYIQRAQAQTDVWRITDRGRRFLDITIKQRRRQT